MELVTLHRTKEINKINKVHSPTPQKKSHDKHMDVLLSQWLHYSKLCMMHNMKIVLKVLTSTSASRWQSISWCPSTSVCEIWGSHGKEYGDFQYLDMTLHCLVASYQHFNRVWCFHTSCTPQMDTRFLQNAGKPTGLHDITDNSNFYTGRCLTCNKLCKMVQ
jgi:hypothetical protein